MLAQPPAFGNGLRMQARPAGLPGWQVRIILKVPGLSWQDTEAGSTSSPIAQYHQKCLSVTVHTKLNKQRALAEQR
jgi:hypothetical protein